MTETVLFVGGSADGMRKIYSKKQREFIKLPVFDGPMYWIESSKSTCRIETYCRHVLHSPSTEYPVYLISTESPDNLIPLLIAGYRKDKI